MDEKMKILKMLESGSITSQEAAELLSAVGSAPRAGAKHTERPNSNDNGKPVEVKGEDKHIGLDLITGEVKERLGTLAKELEPRLIGLAGKVAEKTAELADKMAKSASETLATPSSMSAPEREYTPALLGPHETELSFDISLPPSCKSLSLLALNAPLIVRGYNGDKITARVRFLAHTATAQPTLSATESRCALNYDPSDFKFVSIDAYVPSSKFTHARMQTTNAKLSISGIAIDNITAECTNAPMSLTDITASCGKFENINAPIQTSNLDVKELSIYTSNAPINFGTISYNSYSSYDWSVETSNSRLFLNLPTEVAYQVRASTVFGKVSIGVIGLSYSLNTATNVEAKSPNFEISPKRVVLSLETTNGDIVVDP